jgi:Mlc titration factor MtfA (ptsG expression regulator)
MEFGTEGAGRNVQGMVGTGFMNGMMILSQPDLHRGFINDTDKQNVAIHEFVHLLDKEDGNIDGVPEVLMDNQFAMPWMELVQKEIQSIQKLKSDINPYAAYNKQEFLAVTSEYFFERPELMEEKHPELYKMLQSIFKQNMKTRLANAIKRIVPGKNKKTFSRNSPCPCGSGKKYKKCCGKG